MASLLVHPTKSGIMSLLSNFLPNLLSNTHPHIKFEIVGILVRVYIVYVFNQVSLLFYKSCQFYSTAMLF